MKRLLFILSVVIFGLFIFFLNASFLYAATEGDYTYTVIGGTTSQIDGYTGAGGDITIPSTLGGLPVTSIGNTAFINKSSLTGVIIPNSVTNIGNSAFKNCSALASVVIGNGLTSISDYTFQNCTGLISVTIGNSVASIGVLAFYNCPLLTSFTIPASVTSIGDSALETGTGLTEIIVNSSNLNYSSENGVLFNKDKTTLIKFPGGKAGDYTVPDSVTSIFQSAFRGSVNLTDVIISNNVTSLGGSAFYDSGLTSVIIGSSVASMGQYAFSNCTNLTSVVIPNSVTSVGFSLFSGCTNLVSATIGSGINTIMNSMFSTCPKLASIVIPNNIITIESGAFSGCTGLTSVTIGNSVTTINQNAFYNCSKLVSVTIPSSVTSIGNTAFRNSTKLAAAFFAGNAPTMGTTVFLSVASGFKVYYVSGSTGFTNPWNTYTTVAAASVDAAKVSADKNAIVDNLVRGANINLANIKTSLANPLPSFGAVSSSTITWVSDIPEVVSDNGQTVVRPAFGESNATVIMTATITNGAVSDTKTFTLTVLAETLDFSYTIIDDVAQITGYIGTGGTSTIPAFLEGYPVTSIADYALIDATTMTGVVIPSSVTSIGVSAFQGSGIRGITIPDSVTSIGEGAFQHCSNLTSVSIGSGLTVLNNNIFSGNISLTNIVIPNNITSIYSNVFSGSGLISIVIPNSVTYIGYSSFSDDANLSSVTIGSGLTRIEETVFKNTSSLTNIVIPSNITSIGFGAFENSGLTSIVIPDSVISLDAYAFNSCANLSSVTIGSGLTTITEGAFSFCSSLANITIPNSISAIGDYAFQQSGLLNITIPSSVTNISTTAFQNCSGLTSIAVDNDNLEYSGMDGVLFNKNKTTLITYPSGKTGAYIIPNSVTSIGDSAFSYSRLVSINIPDRITNLGSSAFSYSTFLADVTLGNGLTIINANTFFYCSSLASINIPSSVTSIGDQAFQATGLTSLIIPNSVTNIGSYVCSNCSSLTSVTLSDNLSYISYGAFSSTPSLTSINIPYGVIYIDTMAFQDSGLTSAVISNSVASIGVSTFQGCANLSSIIMPASITTISDVAFFDCTSLVSAYFLGDAPTMASDVFYNTDSGFKIYYPADKTGYTNPWYGYVTEIGIPDSVSVSADKNNLLAGSIKGSNTDLSNITVHLANPLPAIGYNGSTIIWVSNTPSVVSNDGQTITRPVYGGSNANVTMTATFTKGVVTDNKVFNLIVLAETTDPTPPVVPPTPVVSSRSGGGIPLSILQSISDKAREEQVVTTTIIPGCAVGNIFSTTTGQKCPTNPINSNKTIYTFNNNLYSGITSFDVKELQKYLNNNGFIVAKTGAGSKGNETTKFGLATRAALIKFQKANNISPAVGYFGPLTRKMVNLK